MCPDPSLSLSVQHFFVAGKAPRCERSVPAAQNRPFFRWPVEFRTNQKKYTPRFLAQALYGAVAPRCVKQAEMVRGLEEFRNKPTGFIEEMRWSVGNEAAWNTKEDCPINDGLCRGYCIGA